ncbi:MAG: acyl-CoA thioesterase domain-containing protein [Terriglobales bacterium]
MTHAQPACRRSFADDFALEKHGHRFTKVLGDRWTFAGHVFGGYSGALLVAATAKLAAFPELLSANLTFLRRVVAGPVEVKVDEVLSARSAWVGRAVLAQNGEPSLIGDVWFAKAGTLAPVDPLPDPPGRTQPAPWYYREYPFMNVFEHHAVDYPIDLDHDPPESPPRLNVWARAQDALAVRTPLERQLFTIMLIDGYIIDAAVRPHGLRDMTGLSHNLAIHWTAMPTAAGWFEFRAEAFGKPELSATRGEVRGANGPCAWALQQGRVRPRS